MILDTNALSGFADGDDSLLQRLGETELYVPVIVVGEYRYGIRRSRHRVEYEGWLEKMLRLVRLLPVVDSTTHHYAAICEQLRSAGTPIPTNDAWISALAREHSMPIVSRDAHFDCVTGVTRADW